MDKKIDHNIELLAPAGSMESLYAAVNNGCNAVYLGGSKFSARAYASNFDNENMKKAVDYCHSYNVKVYVTMNTLLKEHEMNEAIKYVGYLYEIGVDALIVQDLGLVKLIQKFYKDFEIHASTQLTIHNGLGAVYFKEKGFTRIVLSRELSFKEIEYISKELNIETEIFIHGALCVCYSGKCLMSSLIGGRSGNRGRCAQPCRMEYKLKGNNHLEKKGYLLSPKDMCTIDDVEEIIKSKASSLKIEGRMKRPEYVAGVVSNYRRALDKELYNKEYDVSSGKKVLLQLFNREGFSEAYLRKNTGRDMMSYSFPKNTGVPIGKVLPDSTVFLESDVSVGDGIRVADKGFTISKIVSDEGEVSEASANKKVKIYPRDYKKGDILYRTSSKKLFASLEDSIKPYIKKIPLKTSIEFKIDNAICIKTNYNGKSYEVYGDKLEKALKRPLEREKVIENLKKSGEYPFKIEEIEFIKFDEGFLRISSINNLRRELFEKIIKDITSLQRRKREKFDNNLYKEYINSNENYLKESLSIDYLFTCTKASQVKVLINKGYKNIALDLFARVNDKIEDSIIDKCNDVNFYISVPEIIKGEYESIVSLIKKNKDKIAGIVTSNAAIIEEFKDKLNIIGDYKLNVFNSKAFEFYKKDINNITLSLELNKQEIKELMKDLPKDNNGSVMYVYGKPELMVSEYCPIGSTFGGKTSKKTCSGACMKDEFTLVDRMNENFKIITDEFCRSHILNNVPINLLDERDVIKHLGINTFRIDFKDENEKEVIRVINMIENKLEVEGKLYTKGHFKRGVL